MRLPIKKGKTNIVEELREKLQIDKNNLDEEMLQQPFLFMRVSEEHVLAISQRDAAKEDLARTDAKLAEKYRKQAARESERTSETKIGDLVVRDEEHVDAQDTWAEAKRKADTLFALKESFEQRAKMLRELASLYVSSYFDRVTVKGGEADVKNAKATIAKQAYRRSRAAADD